MGGGGVKETKIVAAVYSYDPPLFVLTFVFGPAFVFVLGFVLASFFVFGLILCCHTVNYCFRH